MFQRLLFACCCVLAISPALTSAGLAPSRTPDLASSIFRLWYNTSGDDINFIYSCACTTCGWCSVGFGSSSSMTSKDTYTGRISGSTVTIQDEWTGNSKSQPSVDSTKNNFNIRGELAGGSLTLAFSRLRKTLDTSRDYEFKLDGSTVNVIFAFSPALVRWGVVLVGGVFFLSVCLLTAY
jgi:hypothetical protein